MPKFDFKGTTENQAKFQATSEVLEYTGVSAYLGQVGNIKSPKVLGAAGSILPVEAWHAAWIADLRRHGAKPYPAPLAFAAGKTKAQILDRGQGHRLHRRVTRRPRKRAREEPTPNLPGALGLFANRVNTWEETGRAA